MVRPFVIELFLFSLPFALYALALWVGRKGGVLDRANWPITHVLWLMGVAVVLVIGSLVVMVHWSGAPPGSTYIPAHVEDGKFVPGRSK